MASAKVFSAIDERGHYRYILAVDARSAARAFASADVIAVYHVQRVSKGTRDGRRIIYNVIGQDFWGEESTDTIIQEGEAVLGVIFTAPPSEDNVPNFYLAQDSEAADDSAQQTTAAETLEQALTDKPTIRVRRSTIKRYEKTIQEHEETIQRQQSTIKQYEDTIQKYKTAILRLKTSAQRLENACIQTTRITHATLTFIQENEVDLEHDGSNEL